MGSSFCQIDSLGYRFKSGMFQQCDDLQSFSKAHIVSKDAAKSELCNSTEPAIAGFLIVTKNGFHGFRNFIIAVSHRFHITNQ